MAEIGEAKTAKELGYRSSSGICIYQPCPDCATPRWVRRSRSHKLCVKCARKQYLKNKQSGKIDEMLRIGQAKLENGIVLYQHPCRVCGTLIWHQKRDIDRCCSLECARTIRRTWDQSPQWHGGRRISRGYVEIRLRSGDPYFAMATKCHYVREHRLVMARHLGRCLETWEVVHHKNGDILDNGLENLELLPNQTSHRPSIAVTRQLNTLEKRVDGLEQENQSLKSMLALVMWHLKDIRHDIDNTEPSKSPDGALGVRRDYGPSILGDKDSDIVRSFWKQE